MPAQHTFGFEYEVRGNGLAVAHHLHDAGAIMHDARLCPYHGCGSQCCDHEDTRYLFSAQHDCTVSAEFPSRKLVWGSDRAELAFDVMQWASTRAGADLSGNSGMHVHVGKQALRPRETVDGARQLTAREKQTWRVQRIFVRYQDDIIDIARGSRGLRGYNSRNFVQRGYEDLFWNTDLDAGIPLDRNGQEMRVPNWNVFTGSCLDTERHRHTFEFRIWNAVKSAWRMRLAVGMSVAITRAAANGVDVERNDSRSMLDVLARYMDDLTIGSLLRQHSLSGIE